MQRSRIVRSAVTLTALTLVAGGGAYALHGGRSTPPAVSPRLGLAAYRSFSGCDDLLSYLRTQALPLVGAFGLDGQSVPGGPVGLRGVAPGALPRAADGAASTGGVTRALGAAATSATEPSGATSATGTNIQVAGVDEADVTKKSGDLVLTVAAGAHSGLTVLRASDRQVRVIGRLATDWSPEQLLVQGTTVLLLGTVPEDRRPGPIPGADPRRQHAGCVPLPTDQPKVRVAEVDVADPAQPRLVRTLDLDGGLVGARLAGGVVRLAVAATPSRLPFVRPELYPSGTDPQGDAAARSALDANRRVVRTAPVTDWLPRWTLTPAGGSASSGSLLDCDRVGVPTEFSGLGTLAMLTFDLRSGGVDHWDGAGVVASGTTLYSTGDHTYVATRRSSLRILHPPVGEGRGAPDVAIAESAQRTLVHEFETSAAGVRYLGSGSVDGSLLGQYAMDEYQGALRVASTVQPGSCPALSRTPQRTAPARLRSPPELSSTPDRPSTPERPSLSDPPRCRPAEAAGPADPPHRRPRPAARCPPQPSSRRCLAPPSCRAALVPRPPSCRARPSSRPCPPPARRAP